MWHYNKQCVIIEDLLAAGAKDLPLDSPFPLVNDDFCARIDTNGSAPDCPYGEHCEEWTPIRAAAFYGCPEQMAELIASQHPISQNTEDSALGSLLYTAASAGRTAVVKMLADPSFQMWEAIHLSFKETPLDDAVRVGL